MWALKFFWSLAQWVFLGAIAAWLYFSVTGDVSLTWGAYTIAMNGGVAASLLFVMLVVVIAFSHLIGDLVRLPSDYMRKRRDDKRAKGHQTLLRALSAASAGDYKNAYYLAHRAQKFLPVNEHGLSLLLQAHAAKSQGKDVNANAAFEALVQNPDTSVLGVQGLLQKRVLDGDMRGALELARAQMRSNPKNAHLLRPVYDLEKRNRLWNDALITLEKLQKAGIVTRDEANKDRAILWLILGDMAKSAGRADDALRAYQRAFDSNQRHAGVIGRLVRAHNAKGGRYRAVSIAKRAIEKNFHPSLVDVWAELRPSDKDLRWFTWLIERHPTAHAYCALARAAIGLSLWGEAKAALMNAEKIDPTKEVYQLWVTLEEKTGGNQSAIRQWLDRQEKAKSTETWTCSKTGRTFADYTPVVEPESLFDTVRWGIQGGVQGNGTTSGRNDGDSSQWSIVSPIAGFLN